MKIRALSVALLLVSMLLTGCRKTPATYKCMATITPAGNENAYEAHIELIEIRGRSETVICSPKVMCAPDQLAKISVWQDEQKQSGFVAEVLVPELEAGGTARCAVHLKDNGHTKFLSDFRLSLSEKPQAIGE